jgi:hypothetical protein
MILIVFINLWVRKHLESSFINTLATFVHWYFTNYTINAQFSLITIDITHVVEFVLCSI